MPGPASLGAPAVSILPAPPAPPPGKASPGRRPPSSSHPPPPARCEGPARSPAPGGGGEGRKRAGAAAGRARVPSRPRRADPGGSRGGQGRRGRPVSPAPGAWPARPSARTHRPVRHYGAAAAARQEAAMPHACDSSAPGRPRAGATASPPPRGDSPRVPPREPAGEGGTHSPCGVAGRRAARAALGAVPAPLPAPPRGRCAGGAPRGGGAGRGAKFHSLRAATPAAPANPRGRAGGRICIFVTPALIGRPRGGRRRALTRRLGSGGSGVRGGRGGRSGDGAREGACAGRGCAGGGEGTRERASFLPETPSPSRRSPRGRGSPGGAGAGGAEPEERCVRRAGHIQYGPCAGRSQSPARLLRRLRRRPGRDAGQAPGGGGGRGERGFSLGKGNLALRRVLARRSRSRSGRPGRASVGARPAAGMTAWLRETTGAHLTPALGMVLASQGSLSLSPSLSLPPSLQAEPVGWQLSSSDPAMASPGLPLKAKGLQGEQGEFPPAKGKGGCQDEYSLRYMDQAASEYIEQGNRAHTFQQS